MVGSLWTGILGLNAQQKALENESNNIANVNTVGFKSARINFSEQLYSSGLGHGSSVENYQKNFNQGSIKTTGRQYDMALQGDGFFAIQSNNKGTGNYFRSETTYTRAGNFDISTEAYLSTPEGFNVLGWTTVAPTTAGGGTPEVANGLNANTSFTEDYEYLIYNNIDRDPTANTITSVVTKRTDYVQANSSETTDAAAWAALKTTAESAITTYITTPTTANFTTAETAVKKAGGQMLELTMVVTNTAEAEKKKLDLDLTRLKISDNAIGDFSINENGEINIYQGGADIVIGQVAVAKFKSNSGLEPIGKNLFRKTIDSGIPYYASNNSKMATLQGEAVEVSNADLSESLINMIVYQRAFEANAKTITTSDELLTTLLGIKR
jgi:flagellar hook protein FlgE